MAKLKTINTFRRTLMQSLTKNIGNEKTVLHGKEELHIQKILICRPNGRLGNLLLITPLLQEVINTYPDCQIDIFVKGGLAPILFKNYKNVNQIIALPGKPFKQLVPYITTWLELKKNSYDLVINVIPTSSSGRLSTKTAKAKYKTFGILPEEYEGRYEDYSHIAKHPVYTFREYIGSLGAKIIELPIASLDLRLNSEEIENGKQILKSLVKNDNKTICIFTYATGEKCLSETWWEEMYRNLQTRFPEYNIIEVLPKENVSQISFKATTFYSRDIREIGALIHNTAVFIGADSGMMHLASAVHTPTVGLFCITETKKYTPYNNQSIAINTSSSTIEECVDCINNILNPSII